MNQNFVDTWESESPWEVSLDKIRTFRNGKSLVVWLFLKWTAVQNHKSHLRAETPIRELTGEVEENKKEHNATEKSHTCHRPWALRPLLRASTAQIPELQPQKKMKAYLRTTPIIIVFSESFDDLIDL